MATIIGDGAGNLLTGTNDDDLISGLDGDDDLSGLGGDDTLDGGTGDDTMAGALGNDSYIVDSAGDIVTEGAGADVDTVVSSISYTLAANLENLTLAALGLALNGTGNAANNVIIGNDFDNTLSGLAGNDTISADDGNDTVDGGMGADSMAGGRHDDVYVVDSALDDVTENMDAGTDTVRSAVSFTLGNNVENLVLTASGALTGTGNGLDNALTGGTGANSLSGLAGNDTLNGGAGADTMTGGIGDDSYMVDNAKDAVTEALMEGTDTVLSSVSFTLGMNVENLVLTGAAALNGTGNDLGNAIAGNDGNNKLSGLGGNDTLDGGLGADTLDGGDGQNTLRGGLGNDTYVVDDELGDIAIENAGEGIDTVLSSDATYTLLAEIENLTLAGKGDINGSGNDLDNVITGNDGINSLEGLTGNDTIRGGGADDSIFAGDGNDSLDGGLGNDFLSGDAGADTMAGSAGNDSYVIDDAGDLVMESGGIDEAISLISHTLANNVENLTLIGSGLTGTGNALANTIVTDGESLLQGLAGNDTIGGSGGSDTIDGGAGTDKMTGGAGDDFYTVDNAKDLVIENAMDGIDTVSSSVTFTLGLNVDNLMLTGTSALGGTGNDLDNTVSGNAGNNKLSSLGGDDSVDGGAGNDTIDGGPGADTLGGGLGNDTYMVDDPFGDMVLENAGEGIDTVLSSADASLAANVENLTLIGAAVAGTGNELDNLITGNDSDNTLEGLEGKDTVGGGGGADLIAGGDGSDSLDGGLGDDFLTGDGGADTMNGGAGNDTYLVDDAGDVVSDSGGIDEVVSQIDYTLAANVENLTLLISGTVGTGNSSGNVMTTDGENVLRGLAGNDTLNGSAGNDTLDGGMGTDSMTGGFGDDTYVVDNAADAIVENIGEGIDTVRSSVSYTLGDGVEVETLNLTGRGNLNGTGNKLDNTVSGNVGNNVLMGMDGDDTLLGGAGNDMVAGGIGMDLLVGGEGTDTLTGGADSDRHDFNSLDGSVDIIAGFSSAAPGMGGDILDLADLLIGFDPMQSVIDNFVQYVQQGGDTRVQVNADGMGADFVAVAVLQGVVGVTAGQALANGNLDVTPDV
jgi:Ca2+-binding RTX toxin-like protein